MERIEGGKREGRGVFKIGGKGKRDRDRRLELTGKRSRRG